MPRSLTDVFCKSVPPRPRVRKTSDARCVRLEFRVTQAGRSRVISVSRSRIQELQRATLGAYPDIGLSKARELADKMRKRVAEGVNPVEQKRREREDSSSAHSSARQPLPCRDARRHKRERSIAEDERNLKKHDLLKWAKRDTGTFAGLMPSSLSRESWPMASRPPQPGDALVSKIFRCGGRRPDRGQPAQPATQARKEGVGRRSLASPKCNLLARDH